MAEELRLLLRDKEQIHREESLRRGRAIPSTVVIDSPMLDLPKAMIRIFDRDLHRAGIEKSDLCGRTVDVHALRHTYATWLAKAGVHPKVAQILLRHSSIDLTMNAYTDPQQLDVAGALDSLPSIVVPGEEQETKQVAEASSLNPPDWVVSKWALKPGKPGHFTAIPDINTIASVSGITMKANTSNPLKIGAKVDKACQKVTKRMERDTGLEPATSSLGSWHSTN